MLCQVCVGATALFKCWSILQPRKWQPLPPLSYPSWAMHLASIFSSRWQRSAKDHSRPSYATATPTSTISSVVLMSTVPSSTLTGTALVHLGACHLWTCQPFCLVHSRLLQPQKPGPWSSHQPFPQYQQRLLRGFKVDSSSTSKSFLLIMCCWFSDYKNWATQELTCPFSPNPSRATLILER